jgi:hypothetical protein
VNAQPSFIDGEQLFKVLGIDTDLEEFAHPILEFGSGIAV